jgi:hypothetical protein
LLLVCCCDMVAVVCDVLDVIERESSEVNAVDGAGVWSWAKKDANGWSWQGFRPEKSRLATCGDNGSLACHCRLRRWVLYADQLIYFAYRSFLLPLDTRVSMTVFSSSVVLSFLAFNSICSLSPSTFLNP